MDDKVQALALELATLKTTLNTSKYWLGVLGLFLVGGLGLTNFFAIPSAINSAFVEKGGQGLIEKINTSEITAAKSSAILKSAADQIGEFEPLQMYKCPNDVEMLPTSSGGWASYGCLGQYSAVATCANISWNNKVQSVYGKCNPVTLFMKK